jgi:hypothetical protein
MGYRDQITLVNHDYINRIWNERDDRRAIKVNHLESTLWSAIEDISILYLRSALASIQDAMHPWSCFRTTPRAI